MTKARRTSTGKTSSRGGDAKAHGVAGPAAMPSRTRNSGRSSAAQRRDSGDSREASHSNSDGIAIHALVERNYHSLRKIAQRSIAVAKAADTMTPTSLVAESVIRLMKQRSLPTNSPHLCGLATILMAQAIADRSKLRRAQKRGRGSKPIPIPSNVVDDRRRSRERERERPDMITTAEILRHLEVLGATIPRTMEVVTLHLVLGIPLERVAEMLSISERTAYRELANGRDRLAQRLAQMDEAAS